MLRCAANASPQEGSIKVVPVLSVRRRQGHGVSSDINIKRTKTMANALGYVTETETGFEGNLALVSLTTPIRIVKNDMKTSDMQPDFRIFAGSGGSDIGGGWFRKANVTGREYVSLTLADPAIGPRKVYANLAPVKGDEGRHVILWNPKD